MLKGQSGLVLRSPELVKSSVNANIAIIRCGCCRKLPHWQSLIIRATIFSLISEV
jgi:hypothetical protein